MAAVQNLYWSQQIRCVLAADADLSFDFKSLLLEVLNCVWMQIQEEKLCLVPFLARGSGNPVDFPRYFVYPLLLKTGSLDNEIREFWLAKPSWVMSHYTMIYKHGKHMRDFLGLFIFIVV